METVVYYQRFKTFQQRFFEKVKKTSGCWLWVGTKNKKGYGGMRLHGKMEKAHRVSWLIFWGAIPKGKHVLHHCDNPGCVNPTHLFLGTNADNMRDKTKKGRQAKKLTDEEVKEIRHMHKRGVAQKVIAKTYNCVPSNISYIVNNKTRVL